MNSILIESVGAILENEDLTFKLQTGAHPWATGEMAKTFPLRIIMLEYFFSIEEYFILLFSIVNEKWRVYWFPFSLTKRALEKTTVWDVSVWWQNIVLSLLTSRTCLLVRHMRLNGKKDDTLCCHPRHKQFFFQTKISVRYPSSPFTTAVDWKKYFTVFARHVAFYHQSI